MKNFYYNKIIWHHVALFADLFNDMETYIYDVDGTAIGNKKIPVYLTPKEKVVAALQKGNWDTNGSIVVENYLPSISIVWNGIELDRDRLAGQRNQRRLYVEYENDPDGDGVCNSDCTTERVHTDFKTVPYKLQFEVTVWAKYMDDMAQILENILPFFHTDLHTSIFEKGIGTARDIKVELTGTNLNFVYDLQQPDRRVLNSTLNFDMECNFYKPENKPGRPIKRAYIDIGEVQSPTSAYGDTVSVGVSGGPCFVDLEDNLVSFIKQFELENEIYLSQRYNEVNGLPTTERTEEYPSMTEVEIETFVERDPRYDPDATDYKYFKAAKGQTNYVVFSDNVQDGDVIYAKTYHPWREDSIEVQTVTNVTNGSFTIVLAEEPPVEGYDIVWRKIDE